MEAVEEEEEQPEIRSNPFCFCNHKQSRSRRRPGPATLINKESIRTRQNKSHLVHKTFQSSQKTTQKQHLSTMCIANDRPLIATKMDTQRVEAKEGHIIVQHNYHDHSTDSKISLPQENPARGGVTTPFPLKLHEMLEAIQQDSLDNVISWQPHGRCFVLRKPKEFIEMLPKYFKISKLASFQRQVSITKHHLIVYELHQPAQSAHPSCYDVNVVESLWIPTVDSWTRPWWLLP